MRRIVWIGLAGVVLIAAPAWAGPAIGARIREAIKARLLPDLTEEQGKQLRAIGESFIAEVRKAHGSALRAAAKEFLETVKATLTDAQRAEAKAIAGKLRALPPGQKLAIGGKLLRSIDLQELRRDAAAWIDAKDAATRTTAEERIAWGFAKAIGRRAKAELDLSPEQVESLRAAFAKLLEGTRAARQEGHAIGKAKLAEALAVLTPEQKARLRALKERILARVRPASI